MPFINALCQSGNKGKYPYGWLPLEHHKIGKAKHIQIFEIYFILKHRFQIPCNDESCCTCVHFSLMGNIEIITWRIHLIIKKFYNFIISFVLTMKLLPNDTLKFESKFEIFAYIRWYHGVHFNNNNHVNGIVWESSIT